MADTVLDVVAQVVNALFAFFQLIANRSQLSEQLTTDDGQLYNSGKLAGRDVNQNCRLSKIYSRSVDGDEQG
jgi:hypothetical protein